jgi:hypothetical protein
LTDSDREACYIESTQLAHDLKANGQYLADSPLQPTSLATGVSVREGEQLITDGPFAETREQLGGYFLVDVNNLDEAISIAAHIPVARKGTVEIRPLKKSKACLFSRLVLKNSHTSKSISSKLNLGLAI